MEIARKITFSTFGKPSAKAKSEKIHVMNLVGRANGYTTATGTYGDYDKLSGEFLAVSPEGDQVRSNICILPAFVMGLIKPALDKGDVVDFAFGVGAQPSEKGDTGYGWTVVPLMSPEPADDPLLQLAAKAKAIPALEAPKRS